MNLIRQNVFHFFTVLLFTGLIFHSRGSADTLGWIVLFFLVILNGILFILKKPIGMISWITIVIGILGMIMSTPALIRKSMEYMYTNTDPLNSEISVLHPAAYFSITILFSLFQIQRMMR